MSYGPGDKLPNGEIVETMMYCGGVSYYTTVNKNKYSIPKDKEAEYFGLKINKCQWDRKGQCRKPIEYICENKID